MSKQIEEGDLVVLKSGGPIMTASHQTDVSKNPFRIIYGWHCDWFNEKSELMSGLFVIEQLKKV